MERGRILPDHWHIMTSFLSVRDLCRLMQVSRDWFFLWVTDRAWMYQRNRVCRRFPHLEDIFEIWCDPRTVSDHICKSSERSNSNKRRKVPWVFPVIGIWHVFKRWLMVGKHLDGVRKLVKLEFTDSLIMCMISTLVPFDERIIQREFNINKSMARIDLYWKNGVKFTCCILLNDRWPECFLLCEKTGTSYELEVNYYMRRWVDFLLERKSSFKWSSSMLKILKDC